MDGKDDGADDDDDDDAANDAITLHINTTKPTKHQLPPH